MNSKFQTVLAITATALISTATIVVGALTERTPNPATELGQQVGRPSSSFTSVPPRITEDDPRWDCATMGNKVCGPAGAPAHADMAALSGWCANFRGHEATNCVRKYNLKARRTASSYTPAGPVLVRECFASYPIHTHRDELVICLKP